MRREFPAIQVQGTQNAIKTIDLIYSNPDLNSILRFTFLEIYGVAFVGEKKKRSKKPSREVKNLHISMLFGVKLVTHISPFFSFFFAFFVFSLLL